jgi:hypothetical protein
MVNTSVVQICIHGVFLYNFYSTWDQYILYVALPNVWRRSISAISLCYHNNIGSESTVFEGVEQTWIVHHAAEPWFPERGRFEPNYSAGSIWQKNQRSKIFWDCPFKGTVSRDFRPQFLSLINPIWVTDQRGKIGLHMVANSQRNSRKCADSTHDSALCGIARSRQENFLLEFHTRWHNTESQMKLCH